MCTLIAKKTEQSTYLKIEGEVTIYHVTELKDQLLSNAIDTAEVVLDLGDIAEMDTAGAQLLLFYQHHIQTLQKKFSIEKINDHVGHIFTVLALTGLSASVVRP